MQYQIENLMTFELTTLLLAQNITMYMVKQRENRLRASLEKFISLHKARAVYLGGM